SKLLRQQAAKRRAVQVLDSTRLHASCSPLFCGAIFMYAVLETGGKQYRVAAGDKLEIERVGVDVGQPVTFERVLLLNNDGQVSVGSPGVAGAKDRESTRLYSSQVKSSYAV